MKKLLSVVGGALLLAGSVSPTLADWPEKTVKVIIPFGPGGAADVLARNFQKVFSQDNLLSQPMTVVNVGGHYSIGLRQAMESAPDGYTFTIVHLALMSGEASGAMDFGYRDFSPVAATGSQCQTVTVREDSPYQDLASFVEAAKEKPDSILVGANLGALNHMAGVVLQDTVPGAKFRFVQIGGGAANVSAMSGGQIDASMIAPAELIQYEQTGLRGLALLGPERLPQLPDLPTAKELGYDAEFCFQFWWFAPKGTPQEAIDGFAAVLEVAMETDDIASEIEKSAMQPTFSKGPEFQQLLDETYEKIAPVAQQAAQN